MGKWINAFIGTIVILFIVISVGVFAYLMIVNPIDTTGKSESETDSAAMRELPESCNEVVSTDSYLYPTAEECMTFLQLDYYAPCLNMDPAESEMCMDKLDYALDRECKTLEKTLGIDYEICVVYTLKRMYQESGGS